jgi:ABC-type branched-subunit amino acid transport system substrate-binding protein
MNAYFDELNRKGGIRGEKIRLVSLDDGFNPEKTAENTRALIEQDALALVGYRGTANVQKIVPILQAAGIAEIGNTSGAKSLRDPYVEGLFHLRASTTDEIEAAIQPPPGPPASRASPPPTRTTPSARKAWRRCTRP